MKHIVSEEFFTELLNKPSLFNETKEAIKLDSIKNYLAQYAGRRGGRPPKILQIINAVSKLQDSELSSSDVIKYAGIYLTQIKDNTAPWTWEEIIAAILSDLELTKKYSVTGVSDIKAKELGEQLAHELLEREEEKKQFVKELYQAMKGGSHRIIHQLSQDKFNAVESTIIRSFQLLTSLLDIFYKSTQEPTFKHLLNDLKNIVIKKPEQLTYDYMNHVVIGLIKISSEVKKILLEDKPRGYEPKVSEIENLQKVLKTVSGKNYMLWPETELDIKVLSDLSKYFQEVKAYRTEAEKLIAKYPSRGKELVDKKMTADDWTEAKIKTLIYAYIEKEDLGSAKYNEKGVHIKTIIDLAEQILLEHPSLALFYKKNSDEKAIYELIDIIAKKITRYTPLEIRFGLERGM